jgi:DNA topoisomerase-1
LAEQKFTQPPPRYNDASIIKKLEELGIGRPSTYASIISVIIARGYVERQQKKFFATSVGETVTDFLLTNLRQFMEYDFTAELEEELDEIARGEKKWTRVLEEFYEPFNKQVVKVGAEAERAKIPVEETGEKCPLCGDTEGGRLVIRQGKFGKFISCSRFPECKYTQNMQQVIAGLKCPLCREGDVVQKPSRWGKNFYGCSRYPDCDWASWSKPEPGFTLTKAQWAKMQAERAERKKAREAARALKKEGGGKKKTAPKKKSKKSRARKTSKRQQKE